VFGALGASGAALLGFSFPVQVAVFVVTSAVLIGVARPPLRRWAGRSAPLVAMNAAALVGREATVLDLVTEHSGLVKLAGEAWTARTEPGAIRLEVGSLVHVVRIDGATAVVAGTSQLHGTPEPHGGEPA
jgi:membrane protein implicated in regulation of membrane protease activity